jgi:hypothetical protein
MKAMEIRLAVVVICAAQLAVSQISPGPLSKAHADLEGISNCTKCHESGQAINGTKCLTCHIEIKNQISSGHGFHFVNASTSCITCHTEHNGLDAKITKFDESQFDHSTTGFVLAGKHSAIRCEQCHNPKNINNGDVGGILASHPHKTFLGLNPQCVSCHPDRHNGTVNTQCQTCHGVNSWSPATTFDHARTKFALVGKHSQIACSKCHEGLAKMASVASVLFSAKAYQDCTPCHASPHGRKFSDKTCRSCHTAESWSTVVSFNHATTSFPLDGKHATVQCEKCHTEMKARKNGVVSFATKKFEDCTPCHSGPHNPKFSGRACKSCHTAKAWKTLIAERFDHSLTNYDLEGKHALVKCEQCHQDSRGTEFARRFLLPYQHCTSCHADYHDGQFKERYSNNCAECHTVGGFKPSTFSIKRHDQTLFTLIGAHIAVPCDVCHKGAGTKSQVFHFANFRCEACHADFHKGQFKQQMVEHSCAQCHSTVEWKMTSFDHAKTRFPLVGKHKTVPCSDCHKETIVNGVRNIQYLGLPTDCQSCHKDVHAGQFAENGETRCAACHSPKHWRFLLFNHETQSSFHLTGAHKKVPCAGCHKEEQSGSQFFIRYKPVASRCESCHQGMK